MKILYIANIRLPTEKAHGIQIMKMCEAFADLGYGVELVVPWRFNWIKTEPFEYYGVKKNFKITRLPSLDLVKFGRIGFLAQSASFAESASWYTLFKKTDIIYSRDELPLFCLSFFKRNLFLEAHDGRLNFIIKNVLKRCPGIVAITKGLKDFYVNNGVDSKKIVVAADAVDIADFSKKYVQVDVRKKLGLPLDKKIVMYIGRLDGWKGTKTLFAASEMLPGVQTVVIGGETKQIEQLKKEYPRIIFLGHRPYKDLAENQAAADVLLLPNTGKNEISARYTSPLKLFAYMASNIPIVASDLPSIREILNEGNSVLVEPDNPQALAEGVKKVLENKELGERLALAAKEKVNDYTWDKRAEKITEFLFAKL